MTVRKTKITSFVMSANRTVRGAVVIAKIHWGSPIEECGILHFYPFVRVGINTIADQTRIGDWNSLGWFFDAGQFGLVGIPI